MSFTFREFPVRPAEPIQAPPSVVGPLPRLWKRPFGFYRNVFKRAFDVTAIVVAAPVIVPVIAALSIGVALEGGRPFYSQLRVGKGGKTFRMWKLRSMVHNAESQLQDLLQRDPTARAEWDATQKLRQDPRITRFGRFLRRSSLDELPQLWNVFKGDMSLVGPRPMMVEQRSLYPGSAYYALRPGITGYWQTAGRNQTTFQARAEYDTVYDDGLAFTADLRILWRTISVVLKGTGC
ncbi:sugar transferase [Pseudorhodobacter sp. MZDSW-24AT]|uniref:sugar transferase n=1 Tax=Pseudorhodobacter sp. MZDSW-24AT TaxID=2052957 RepID=UPI000C1E7FA5|nr:sugar transferase [Pseudorhodobacter sp. MZDSW-24AT]PJF09786.1 sugar transferase [Pseudorhodobacter sp. MZDSW-24AT]